MSGFVLRLAGPLQSWGEHSAFSERDTTAFPTRSGLLGMFAAAEGRRRTDPIDDYATLGFTVRIDRPGVPLVDFHTAGGGYPPDRAVATAEGKRRTGGSATLITRRHYLSDAVFTVAVDAPASADKTVTRLARALERPVWPLYLGRRSCPPTAPLLLRPHVADPVAELYALPLTPGPVPRNERVVVDFVFEVDDAGLGARTELNDVPVTFAPRSRRYRTRQITVRSVELPRELCSASGSEYLERLASHLSKGAA